MNPYGTNQYSAQGLTRYDGQPDVDMFHAGSPLYARGSAHGTMSAGGHSLNPSDAPASNANVMPRPADAATRPPYSRQGSDMYASHQQQQQQQQQHSPYSPNHDPQQQQQQQQQRQPPGSASGLPGSLQSAPPPSSSASISYRPGPSSSTAPNSVPQLPPLTTQPQQSYQQQASSRGSTAHSYSRSSPDSRYPQTPSRSYMQSQTPQNAPFSPLGLADIRGGLESGVGVGGGGGSDELLGSSLFDGAQAGNCQYLAPWPAYAFDWCKWPVPHGDSAGKMAIGSYLEDGHNYIQVLDTKIVPDSDLEPMPGAPQYGIEYVKTAEASHSYPVTRILWEPQSAQKTTCDLLATSGDHLRLWSLPSAKQGGNYGSSITSPTRGQSEVQKLSPLALLSNSKSPEHTAPLTSLDWNTLSPSLIITSSIDTTCTIWDIPSLTAKTQLIAHDKEVFDVRFCANSVDVFVSCGADGSVRMFDLRSLEHSTIIYEPSEKDGGKGDQVSSPGDSSPTKQPLAQSQPLLRLAASPHDSHLLATFSSDSPVIRILDVRQPGQALLELSGHQAAVNCIEWSPSRRGMLASGGDDSMVLIWDLVNAQSGATPGQAANGGVQVGGGAGGPGNNRTPSMAWTCDYEVNNLSWAPQSRLTSGGQANDWVGISGGRGIWGLCV